MKTEKVIIDTDIGDDIDDTLALMLACQSQEIDLIGVATVSKNTVLRGKVARYILKQMGKKDVLVACGYKYPLEKTLNNPFYLEDANSHIPRQYSKEMKDEELSPLDVIDFYNQKIHETDEPITIITLGPLTNIASLLIRHPMIKTKIKKIIMMGGAYYLNTKEFNITSDPHAAQIVFESGIDVIGVGLDVTNQCQLNEGDLQHIKEHDIKLYDLINQFMNYRNHIPYLHDPLAVAVLINDSLVDMEEKAIMVETNGEYTTGLTVNISTIKWLINKENYPKIRVCKHVKRNDFVEMLLKRILK